MHAELKEREHLISLLKELMRGTALQANVRVSALIAERIAAIDHEEEVFTRDMESAISGKTLPF